MQPKSTVFAAVAAIAILAPLAARAEGLEVRVCPADVLHAAPLAPGTRFQSLVVPALAVTNRGATSAEVVEVDFELLDKGVVVDSRRLAGEGLRAVVNPPAALQAMQNMLPVQFCDGALLGAAPRYSRTSTLAPANVLVMGNQTFGWKGARDALRITAVARRAGDTERASVTVPVRADTVMTPMRFPLAGRWMVVVAGTPHGGHRWALPEAFAYDIVRMGDDDKSFRGAGRRFEDYFAYGAPVLAAADGTVVDAVTDQPEDVNVLRRPDESLQVYGDRMGAVQMKLLAQGDRAVMGNAVVVDQGHGEYALYAHLKPGSVKVAKGDRVKAGDVIGRLGSSGNSTEPHLHFQVCDGPRPLHCAGIPLAFTNVELPYADGPRAIQAGDVVIAR